MIKKILKYLAIGVVCLLVVGAVSLLLYRAYLQNRIARERAITSPNGINSLESVRIGGINQWIEVRGQNVNNPILLFIHGGPGVSFIPLARSFEGPWEKYFTVVQWDQRGAGKTYASNSAELQRNTMSVAQMEQDSLEVVNYLRARFKRDKIFVMGHSWGSVLGLWLAREHPETIYAYVGTGQVINFPENEELAYKDALQQARARQNAQAVKELESIAPYPSPNSAMDKVAIAKKWEAELLGPPAASLDGFFDIPRILSAPEYSLKDDYAFIRGQTFSPEVMLPELMQLELSKMGAEFHVPVFFLEGRLDPYCRPSLVWNYSQRISAPQKEFVWFDNSGHFPFFEERQKFTDELVQRVLTLGK